MKTKRIIRFGFIIIILVSPFVCTPKTLAQNVNTLTRVSVASDGEQSNFGSYFPSVSVDGRFISFVSYASNLASSDTNYTSDIFVHDRLTGKTTSVSMSSDGVQGNDSSYEAAISGDSRIVSFMSVASNLVPGISSKASRIYVHDRQTRKTERVDVPIEGSQAVSSSRSPGLSHDGRFVVFNSSNPDLVPDDTNGFNDVFVRDRITGQTERVSVSSEGIQANDLSEFPSISSNGRYIAYKTEASNLVQNDTNGTYDIIVFDRQTRQTNLVSVSSNGTQGEFASFTPSLSEDGRFVAFQSWSRNLVKGDTNNSSDIFVRDLQSGLTSRVSISSDGTQANYHSSNPSISYDGRYITFSSKASNLVKNDTNSYFSDIFIHDRLTGETKLVSASLNGIQGRGNSDYPSLSGDGQAAAFESDASALVDDDTNGFSDIFIYGLKISVPQGVREPVILLPGFGGSEFKTTEEVNLSVDNGHGGVWNHVYNVDSLIWINVPVIAIPSDDDFLDILKYQIDGKTPVATSVSTNKILTTVISGFIEPYLKWRPYFESLGYTYNTDLFEFPYDFRKDITLTSNDLDAFVYQALVAANSGETNESLWTVKKVNLVSHSMGGKVVREYIRDPARAGRVQRVIALAPAYLGAPLFFKALLFGDDAGSRGLMNPQELKDIIQNWPGAFENGPSRLYWKFYDGSDSRFPVPFKEDRDFDGDNQISGSLTYDQTRALLERVGSNMNVFQMAESFHDSLDTSWNSGLPVPEVHIVAGTNTCTPGQLRAYYGVDTKLLGQSIQLFPKVDMLHVNGDGTVPLFSATMEDASRALDYNNTAKVYFADKKDHGQVAVSDATLNLVTNILRGDETLPTGISTNRQGSCSGKIISVESPVELHIYDSNGNHTGLTQLPEEGAQQIEEQAIPESTYEELLESKYIFLPDDGTYTIRLKATDEGFFTLRLRDYREDRPERTISYLNVPLTQNTTGEMEYDTSSNITPALQIDSEGDGTFEKTINATSDLGPDDSADTTPPSIEIVNPAEKSSVLGDIKVVWKAEDGESGILNEIGVVDRGLPSATEVSNGVNITLPQGEHTLTVVAHDRFGNASEKTISFTVLSATVYSVTWLPPLHKDEAYATKHKKIIPVAFQLLDQNGTFIRDETVQIRVLNANRETVTGPFSFNKNHNKGVKIVGNKSYRYNLRTKGLAPGTYTIEVSFRGELITGKSTKTFLLQERWYHERKVEEEDDENEKETD